MSFLTWFWGFWNWLFNLIWSEDASDSISSSKESECNFVTYCQIPLQIGYTIFHFHLPCKRVPVSVQHCQKSVLSSFGIFAQCMDVKRVVLSYYVWHWAYFLTFKNHLFTFLSGLSILVHFFKNLLFVCFFLIFKSSLYMWGRLAQNRVFFLS